MATWGSSVAISAKKILVHYEILLFSIFQKTENHGAVTVFSIFQKFQNISCSLEMF